MKYLLTIGGDVNFLRKEKASQKLSYLQLSNLTNIPQDRLKKIFTGKLKMNVDERALLFSCLLHSSRGLRETRELMYKLEQLTNQNFNIVNFVIDAFLEAQKNQL